MAERVKPHRGYHSPRRQQQAAATRRAILEAALRLFEQQGYPPTTMEAIAAEAGVALKTVYVVFTTKSGLLRALWDLHLKGDQDDAPVAERPWYREVLDEPSPERQLRRDARNARVVKQRIAGVLKVLRSAAPVDPDAEALWRLIQSDFYGNQRVIVQSLHAKHALRPGLDVTHATDILWTLNHPDVWLLLVGERGWTPEQWEQWFADTACAQLLKPAPPTDGGQTEAKDTHSG
jgi:AcrR family transcriptional regulator